MDIEKYLIKNYTYKQYKINNLNQYNCKPIYWTFNDNDVDKYNKLIEILKASDLNKIIRTPSGGIANGREKINNHYAWDVVFNNSTGVRLTVSIYGKLWVFKFGSSKENKPPIYPSQAFKILKDELLKDNIDLEDYAIENGSEVKKEIEKPLIYMKEEYLHKEIENTHHIDYHNSYPAGLCNTHPEFRPAIERIYNRRKNSNNPIERDKLKGVLNISIGMMQSLKIIDGKYAHLSRDAIADNNKRISMLAFLLELSGRKIIGFNTDGIWYQGEIYHGLGEGDGLGEWENDHINCKFRAKSDGAYEFIENNKYYPVVRGHTTLDLLKLREEWQWGDIYKTDILQYEFDKKTLLIKKIPSELKEIEKYEV